MNQIPGLENAHLAGSDRSNLFVNRQSELNQLKEHVDNRRGVIVVTGIGGIGKTALVNQFLFSRRGSGAPILAPTQFGPGFSREAAEEWMMELQQHGEVPDVVAIDNVEPIHSAEQIEEFSRVVLNYKRVRTLILITRQISDRVRVPVIKLGPLNMSATSQLMELLTGNIDLNVNSARLVGLAQGNPLLLNLLTNVLKDKDAQAVERFLTGEIYNLANDIIIPKQELIEVVKPKIIMTNQSLVERVQKNPADMLNLSPRQYEELLAELLQDMGYEVELTPETRDGGKDIMAYMDTPHGKILCLVEAKKYRPDRTVGVNLVRQLLGALEDHSATSAMLVTTSSFSPDAKAYQQRHEYRMALRDYENVVQWIDRYKTH